MKLRNSIFGFLGILVVGTSGYSLIEGWSVFDSFYMTAITITTVGFSEVHPLSTGGKVFTLIILFLGFGIALISLSHLAASFLHGEIQEIFGRRRMEKELKKMTEHFILCGFGRMGKVIANEFQKKSVPFVVIEKNLEELRSLLDNKSIVYIAGNANDEETLKLAGIDRARGVVAAVSTDADNAFISMTARGLNQKLRIVARSSDSTSVGRLKLAGANKVVSPYIIGGTRIAQAILNPALVDFIEAATDRDRPEIEMAEVEIRTGCAYDGMSLESPEIKALELIVVSIQRNNQRMLFKPDAKTELVGGDRVIAVGRPEQIQKMVDRAAQ